MLVAGCAQIVTPTGGKVDRDAPKLVQAEPANNTTLFNASKIVLYFDEYIQLKDAQKNIVISPPLKTPATYTVKNKKLSIEISDTLEKAATYKINFGAAIADITEGNTAANLSYVFSTGSFIDSLKISGKVQDSYTLKDDDHMLVALYHEEKTKKDSFANKVLPSYFSYSAKDGSFEISNLKEGRYALLAFADLNNNFLLDEADEKVAFLDSVIELKSNRSFTKPLLSFNSVPNKFFIKKETQTRDHVTLAFNRIPTEHLYYRNIQQVSSFASLDHSPNFDTLTFWYSASTRKLDSLNLILYQSKKKCLSKTCDCMEWSNQLNAADVNAIDTVDINLKKYKPGNQSSERGKNATLQMSALNLVAASKLKPSDYLQLSSAVPLTAVDTSKISIVQLNKPLAFDLVDFHAGDKKIKLRIQNNSDSLVQLTALPSAFESVNQQAFDTLKLSFTKMNVEDLSSLELEITAPDSLQTFILLFRDEAGKTIHETTFVTKNTLRLTELVPGKYSCMLIGDVNRNGRWDAGSYHEKRQAETVYYLNKDIILKPNWDVKEEWNLRPANPTPPKSIR